MLANSGYVMTLANSIIGVGILAMPFCFQKCGIILATLLLILSNWITRVCCHYLIKTSLLTRRKSFEFLGFHAFGTSGKLLVELCIIGYLLGSCITYFVVVGDLGPQIVTKMFSLENEHRHLRTLLMCGVTLFCIIPLGMLKNVDSLSTVCTASIGFYVCLVIKIILESEKHIIDNDWTEKVVYWQPGGVLQCLPIFSMALSCQMQIFEVFTSINNQSLEKLNGIVRNATWICTLVYIAVGFFGYVAFCTQTFSGNILMNLSPSFSSDVIKIGFVLSVAFSFPLVIFPCRASLYSLLYRKGQTDASGYIPETRFKAITIFIVTFSLCIALMIPSVELVIGLVGSTIGVAICIMFPAACFRKIIKKDTTERNLAQFIVISGFCLMILGTYANLSAIDEKSSGSHLEIPKIEEDFLKPTELAKESIDEKIKNIEKALEEREKKEESEKIVNKLKEKELKDTVNQSNIITQEKPSPPPLPVDESHPLIETKEKVEEKLPNKEPENKLPVVLPQVMTEEKKLSNNLTEMKDVPNKPLQPQYEKQIVEKKTSTDSILEVQPQTIDNDAIKKDEEVAKEEYKQENEELKKTQKELEKTKDLLEKKVEELKEELVKQNQETQNLVVEKLGEVVEKFEAIERKVQQKKEEDETASKKEVKEPSEVVKDLPKAINDSNNAKPIKGSLISILTENRTLNNKPVVAPENVYEPLSYKTGELMERVHNGSILEKRLPLPLALLINASQAKMNETLYAKPQIALSQAIDNENKTQVKIVPLPNNTLNKNPEKINVEAIRREILQLKSNPNEITTTLAIDEQNLPSHRNKRSYQTLADENGNCLTEPKADNLLAAGLSSGLELKIGRDLKSIKDEE
ncbi:LOW QUALITY PROTEIN: putative sodium-coupled neutral amino acid transporter 10 [Lucilia sericata]|uniref:LOW QUALITY PROTEIN: putative sodium-coupled neutral amino acid transporter 10 n=1 Tax=Lucilia sericata TaxID=13632 RepID=UPI0018A87D88|nr:LOW QUALITY PROTEIN: putative sodium-coupled neutral amino acid transporter 10 [Lucilia sericata]